MRPRSLRTLAGGPSGSKTSGTPPGAGAPARATPGVRRRIDIDANTRFPSYVEYQALYMDHATGRLIPNTEIWRDGKLELQINAVGCKGPDLERGRPVIAFFGDSTTMGVFDDSWVFHVDVPGYANLNAAVEGTELARLADRFAELEARVPIACSVVCGGWHNLLYNRCDEEYWEEQLSRFLDDDHITVYWTLPTCLTEGFRERGIGRLINRDESARVETDYFNFFGDYDEEILLIPLLEAIHRYNAFVLDFCARNDAPVLDLHAFLRPPRYEEATRDFFDVCHIRPRAYGRVGEYAGGILREILPPAEFAATTAPSDAIEAAESEDLRKNIYPIW